MAPERQPAPNFFEQRRENEQLKKQIAELQGLLPEVEAWRKHAAWSDLVWQDFDGLSDGAKRAYELLLRLGAYNRLIDVNPSALATWIGKTKAARGHEVIDELRSAGLLKYGKKLRGRYIDVSLCDPLDALGPHRQANYPQGEQMLAGIAWHDVDATAQSAPADLVRLAAGDAPPRPPDSEAPDLATREAPDLATREAPDLATRPADPANSRGFLRSAEFGPKSGASPTCTCNLKEDLSSNLLLETLVDPKVQVDPEGAPNLASAEFGPKSGASLDEAPISATPIGSDLAQLIARFTRRRGLPLAVELGQAVPGLWGDWAHLLVLELEGGRDAEHGGEPTPLTVGELASLIVSSHEAVAEGKARKPLPIYFTGTVNRWLSQRGRKRIYVAKRAVAR
jgi:hypothetical protein